MACTCTLTPDNLPAEIVNAGSDVVKGQSVAALSYYDHILGVIPNNVLAPFLSGNVLSVMLIAAAVGLALAFMPKTENREALLKIIQGVQELAFTLIRAILYVLPIGIVAFAGQLSAQIEAGVIVGALGQIHRSCNARQRYSVLHRSADYPRNPRP